MLVSVPYGSPLQVGLALAFLSAVTLVVMTLTGIRQRLDFLGAAARSIVQLILVALVVAWVFLHPAGALLYLAVMLVAATATSVRRIGLTRSRFPVVLAAIAAGVVIAVSPVMLTGALPLEARTLLPFTAQIIGGSMTAVSLTGSRFRDDVAAQWDIVEGYLALGANPRQATAAVGRRAAERSLIPSLDQTRSAGLVVLPGAFVGMLLGGATPAQAAQVQLLVLFALIAANVCASTALAWLLGPDFGKQRPVAV